MKLIKAVKYAGQPVCVSLYAIFTYLAAKKKFIPLVSLFLMHLTEYFIIGKKTGKENKINPVKAFFSCLGFGFTWWLPIRSNKEE